MENNKEVKAILTENSGLWREFSVLIKGHRVRLDPEEYKDQHGHTRKYVVQGFKQVILGTDDVSMYENFNPFEEYCLWTEGNRHYAVTFGEEESQKEEEVEPPIPLFESIAQKRMEEFEEADMHLVRVAHSLDMYEGTITLTYKKEEA